MNSGNMWPQRLELEQMIFSSGAEVMAVNGELFAETPSVRLHVLISVYNAFFAEENRLFLAEDIEEAQEAQAVLDAEYAAEEKRLGGPLPPAFYFWRVDEEQKLKEEWNLCQRKKSNNVAVPAEFAAQAAGLPAVISAVENRP